MSEVQGKPRHYVLQVVTMALKSSVVHSSLQGNVGFLAVVRLSVTINPSSLQQVSGIDICSTLQSSTLSTAQAVCRQHYVIPLLLLYKIIIGRSDFEKVRPSC